MKIPIFKDKNTTQTATEDEPYPGFIHMDSATFGAANSSLQVTYSCRDMAQARHLYDMFAILSPLALALTAGSPIFKGKLGEIDVRWPVIVSAFDDRTPEERDEKHECHIPKCRFDSMSCYISPSEMLKDEYNDFKHPVNEEVIKIAKKSALKEGVDMDERLLRHLGILFMKDPLFLFKDHIELNDKETSDHFENIQSTNWHSVRFKPPTFQSPNNCIWRVEFRTPEIGITEKDNVPTIALVNMFMQIVTYDKAAANFYIPLSKLDENFKRSFERDAIVKNKFWVRRCVLSQYGQPQPQVSQKEIGNLNQELIEVTLAEFFYGSPDKTYVGFLQVYDHVIDMMIQDNPSQQDQLNTTRNEYKKALNLILRRAKGELKTLAAYMREFVMKHSEYKGDSIVPEKVLDELVRWMIVVNEGKTTISDLHG